jgi:hypothetical protein
MLSHLGWSKWTPIACHLSQLWISHTGDALSIFEKARIPKPPAASIIMMKPRKASSETRRSFKSDERESDRRRLRTSLRASRLSPDFFPLLTSAIEFTVELDGELRFNGAPIAISDLSCFELSGDTAMGLL